MWRLQVVEWGDPTRWRWRLSGPAGEVVEHDVELDPAVWQFGAFADLYGFLRWNVSPDRRRVGVGALVLLAFRADIDIARDPKKGWSFRFRTRGLSDSTIGRLLGGLLGHLLSPKS